MAEIVKNQTEGSDLETDQTYEVKGVTEEEIIDLGVTDLEKIEQYREKAHAAFVSKKWGTLSKIEEELFNLARETDSFVLRIAADNLWHQILIASEEPSERDEILLRSRTPEVFELAPGRIGMRMKDGRVCLPKNNAAEKRLHEVLTGNKDMPLHPEKYVRPMEESDLFLSPHEDRVEFDWSKAYGFFSDPVIEGMVRNYFGIKMEEIPLPEQYQCMRYLYGLGHSKQKEAVDFINRFGQSGLRTFLSLDYGKELGEKIVRLGHRLPESAARKLFEKYGEILDSAERATDYIAQELPDGTQSQKLIMETRGNLHFRGRKLLENYAKRIEEGALPEESEIVQELRDIKAENELFLATFKALPEKEKVGAMERMKDASFEIKTGDELTEDDLSQMRQMYARNYKGAKYGKLLPTLLQKFNETLSDKEARARFYIFRHKGVIRAFNRFTNVTASKMPYAAHKYFGAFNVDATFSGASIGETMMLASLDEEAQESRIEADCEAQSAIAMNYIERGFIADRFYQYEDVDSLHIWRDDNVYVDGEDAHAYPSKRMTREEIIASPETISAKKPAELDLERRLDGKHVLTRYFFDPTSKLYYAFVERKKSEPTPSAYIF